MRPSGWSTRSQTGSPSVWRSCWGIRITTRTGTPIPSAEGALEMEDSFTLSQAVAGQRVFISKVRGTRMPRCSTTWVIATSSQGGY